MALVHGLSGVLGGSAAMVVTYPLLTSTIRQQVRSEEKGSLQTILEIFKEEGIAGFYSGVGPAVFGIAASMGIYIFSYERLKSLVVGSKHRELGPLENLLLGYVAGAINTTLTCPIWCVTTRMQARKGKEKDSLLSVIRAVWADSGIEGFWRGWKASLVLCINPAIQWMVYEQLTKVWLRLRNKKTPSTLEVFILGAIGKIAATLVTYPYIVVKSRMQAETSVTRKEGPRRVGRSDDDQLQFQYNGVWDALAKIVQKQGVLGLYSGLESKLFQSVSNAAFMFVFKEQFVVLTLLLLRTLMPKRS